MFVKNKIIDENKIREAIESKNQITEESLRKDWQDVCKMSKEIDNLKAGDDDFNFYEMYEITFSAILLSLTLDELEYINENNLFGFDEYNILDYRCKMNLERKINYYKQILFDLINCMQQGDLGSYFSKCGDLFHMSAVGLGITTFLGLNRNDAELTPEGEKLKTCIENIKQLHKNEIKQKIAASNCGQSTR